MNPTVIGDATIHRGDVRAVLATLPAESVQTVVTSPPYWGLRDYGVDGQIGLEDSPEDWVGAMVDVFSAVRRVLRDDGTLWLNIGDAYGSGTRSSRAPSEQAGKHGYWTNPAIDRRLPAPAKQLLGLPWRAALALQADGWYLRSDIIWHKPNPMPESVTDRPTKAHEYLFLLAKADRYYYDAEAIKEPVSGNAHHRGAGANPKCAGWADGPVAHTPRDHARARAAAGAPNRPPRPKQNESFSAAVTGLVVERNKRDVWTVPTQPFSEAHFATFPPKLIEPCILAGAPSGGVVLDPFHGAGTTGMVALQHGRRYVGIELNADYIAMSIPRIEAVSRQARLFA